MLTEARLDLPPNPSAYVKLPEEFGRRFMIFCDTEAEFDWSKPFDRASRSTTHMSALPAVHDRLRSHGANPVYLVDHPIATDPRSVDILRPLQDSGECSIGAQLHPWVNPPFEEEVTRTNSFAGNLPPHLERAKLECLTTRITESFGRRPVVYRAGRYGVGRNTARTLAELGYRVDVSVRAMFDYSGEKGPDFSRFEPIPYRIGNGPLLEVPLSATYLGALRGVGPSLYRTATKLPYGPGILVRTGLLNRVSLTPEAYPLPEVLQAVEQMLDDGVQLFSISFHSPSCVAGHTPFVRDEADLAAFHAWWEGVLDLLSRRGVAPASLNDLLVAWDSISPSGG
jgi:hypothetical protein